MSRGVANALFLLLFFAFAFLHLYRLGVVTYTWDEGSDLGIVSCLQRTHDPFVCLDDISQTRLPFYIHAIAHTPRSQYLISAAFSLFNFVVIYAFARRELGRLTATLTAALFATSPALLASGRMLLTHSNVIFTTFTLLSFLTLKEYANGGGPSPRDAGRGWRAAPGEGRHSGSLRPPPRARGGPLSPPAGGRRTARRLGGVARARPLQPDSADNLLRRRRASAPLAGPRRLRARCLGHVLRGDHRLRQAGDLRRARAGVPPSRRVPVLERAGARQLARAVVLPVSHPRGEGRAVAALPPVRAVAQALRGRVLRGLLHRSPAEGLRLSLRGAASPGAVLSAALPLRRRGHRACVAAGGRGRRRAALRVAALRRRPLLSELPLLRRAVRRADGRRVLRPRGHARSGQGAAQRLRRRAPRARAGREDPRRGPQRARAERAELRPLLAARPERGLRLRIRRLALHAALPLRGDRRVQPLHRPELRAAVDVLFPAAVSDVQDPAPCDTWNNIRGQGAGGGAQVIVSLTRVHPREHHLRPAPCALPPHNRYATAKPICAPIIIRYMCRHDWWFSVAVSSSGLRTISQTV